MGAAERTLERACIKYAGCGVQALWTHGIAGAHPSGTCAGPAKAEGLRWRADRCGPQWSSAECQARA